MWMRKKKNWMMKKMRKRKIMKRTMLKAERLTWTMKESPKKEEDCILSNNSSSVHKKQMKEDLE